MRVQKTSMNAVALIGQNFIVLVLSFICRTVFINTLGQSYLGANGLFSNIFDVLSLMELGVGTAITYYMYKPLAEGDRGRINGLMILYARFYKYIGVAVATVGFSLVPFLKYIVGKTDIPHINYVYFILLSNVVINYFLSYKRALLTADQRRYIASIFDIVFSVICNLLQVIVLVTTKNYFLYLGILVMTGVASNICIRLRVNKDYPYLKKDKQYELSKEDKRTIYTRMGAAMSHNVGGVLVFSTDNILLSIFNGLRFVGVYSNYTMIINMINNPLQQIYAAMVGSIGNLNITESNEKSKSVFDKVFFLDFWLYGFASLCLWLLINPFILIWVGEKYILNTSLIFVIILNFYLSGMRLSAGNFIYASGLFWNTRFKPLFEAAVNLIASIILGGRFGAIGVFIGTALSVLLGSFWIDPYVLYKEWFHLSPAKYFLKYGIYTIIMLLVGLLFTGVFIIMPTGGFFLFVLRLAVCVIGINSIFAIIFWRTEEFQYFISLVKQTLYKFLRKLRV